ncbi:pilus assembly protein CpaB [Paenarthrobacter sp. DKR-5]|uniref:Flp pilus assembly protein CpaB n=1 Tax=Paenarthrobacter sp. DKR-5 TaxID=2835535 RepID=UPI001BDD9FD7|nr:RcpC/CpaB family pilus assembly protein [Paenarthrobacter sp. DKR-5]MBT1001046.1 pilus assembly protein CpaB [Paenarthrobacter sp. DKR-5]
MKTRLLGGIAAVVLAVIGATLLVIYVQGADRRAQAGLDPVNILVVDKAVPAGTRAEDLVASVSSKLVPATAVSAESVKDLAGFSGRVTSVDLVPGEQLVKDRLVSPASLTTPGKVPVPAGLEEVSISLPLDRVVGGDLAAGDTVGVFVSLDKGAIDAAKDEPTTKLLFHRVLVTGIQKPGSTDSSGKSAMGGAGSSGSNGSVIVTLARSDADASRIVFGATFGTIYLSKESKDSKQSDPGIIRKNRIYQ